jgi:hypothetical protein
MSTTKKPLTTDKLITKMLKEAPSPIVGAMVLQALKQFSQSIVDNKDQVKHDMKNSIIAPELWIETAEYINNYITIN